MAMKLGGSYLTVENLISGGLNGRAKDKKKKRQSKRETNNRRTSKNREYVFDKRCDLIVGAYLCRDWMDEEKI